MQPPSAPVPSSHPMSIILDAGARSGQPPEAHGTLYPNAHWTFLATSLCFCTKLSTASTLHLIGRRLATALRPPSTLLPCCPIDDTVPAGSRMVDRNAYRRAKEQLGCSGAPGASAPRLASWKSSLLLAPLIIHHGTGHGRQPDGSIWRRPRLLRTPTRTPSWRRPGNSIYQPLSARAVFILVMSHICLPLPRADSTTTAAILVPRPPADSCGVPHGTSI